MTGTGRDEAGAHEIQTETATASPPTLPLPAVRGRIWEPPTWELELASSALPP